MRNDKLLLISGSRDWDDEKPIIQLLKLFDPDWTLVIHGKCASGADAIANHYAADLGFTVVRFPANWRPNGQYDVSAGPKRNKQMVDVGVANMRLGVEVHAGVFLLPQSRGTRNTLKMCQSSGFVIHQFGQ
jgi:hypothetical protein